MSSGTGYLHFSDDNCKEDNNISNTSKIKMWSLLLLKYFTVTFSWSPFKENIVLFNTALKILIKLKVKTNCNTKFPLPANQGGSNTAVSTLGVSGSLQVTVILEQIKMHPTLGILKKYTIKRFICIFSIKLVVDSYI